MVCVVSPHGKAAIKILLGQLLSILVAGSGFFNNLLGSEGMNIPIGQNLIFYGMLTLFLIPYFVKNGKRKPNTAIWKYFIIAALDVQGNAMSAYAYQHASLTLVTLLQLLSLPSAMLASVAMKMAKYKPRHYICMAMALLGMIACVLYNSLVFDDGGEEEVGGLNPGESFLTSFNSNAFGIACGAMSPILFGILNALGEKFVTSSGVLEYIGFCGLSASIVCAVETAIFEYDQWVIPAPGLWVITESLVASGYVFIPMYLKHTPVTILNMSMLTIGAYGMILDCLALSAEFSYPDLICEIWSIAFTAIYAWSPPIRIKKYNDKEIIDYRETNGLPADMEGSLSESRSIISSISETIPASETISQVSSESTDVVDSGSSSRPLL